MEVTVHARPRPLLTLALARLVLASAVLLTACAQPLRREGPAPRAQWNGRLALSIQSDPAQALSAGFELRGTSGEGELQLFSPLGTTLAVLTWSAGAATLRQGSQSQTSGSLDSLVAQATGTPLPLAALFDWLNNIPTEVSGWTVDRSLLSEGRLLVRRLDPAPAVELRLKLEP